MFVILRFGIAVESSGIRFNNIDYIGLKKITDLSAVVVTVS